jgi:hypothetical protein
VMPDNGKAGKWLISPQFKPAAGSMLSLFARSVSEAQPERMKVYYLFDSNESFSFDPARFNQLSAGEFSEVPADWKRFGYFLGTHAGKPMRIAIQYVSEEGSMLLLDKIGVSDAQKYTLSLAAIPSDKGSVTGAAQYYEGQQVSLNASPVSGFRFKHWAAADGTVLSTTAAYTFLMPDADYSLTAHFEPMVYNLTLKTDPVNAGTLKGAGGYTFNEQVTIEAEAATGYAFVRWINRDADEVSRNAVYTFGMPARSFELTAVFQDVTGIADEISRSFKVYPNPVRNLLTIESPVAVSKAAITDMSGRELLISIPVNGVIDVSGLLPGLYILKLQAGDEFVYTKIKVMK